MKPEILLQFIVPLTFLAIWALTSLLNRDSQPLPPRPHRGPGSGDPRPGMGLPSAGRRDLAGPARHQGSGRLPSSAAERPGAARWAAPPTQGRPGGLGRSDGPDEGIVILESDGRGSPSSS